MTNIFNQINNFITRKETRTYGDILNPNKQEIFERSMSPQEQLEYALFKSKDLNRLYETSGNNKKDNPIKIDTKREQYISGIYECKQIM